LAHQATEKYLKGFLAAQAIPIPRIHDLPALLRLCLTFLPELALLEPDCDEISRLYPSSRYPGMRDIVESQALKAIEIALGMKDLSVKRFHP
jgi:HEPN domain-containing protein